MSWETIAILLGAVGGLEFIKYILNRKSISRINLAEAKQAEFKVLQETIVFLQQQLKEKEERFADQTQLVRKLNAEVIDLMKEKGKIELELATVRCDDIPCPFRQPPTANTPPQIGLTKEKYHEQKRLTHEKNNTD